MTPADVVRRKCGAAAISVLFVLWQLHFAVCSRGTLLLREITDNPPGRDDFATTSTKLSMTRHKYSKASLT